MWKKAEKIISGFRKKHMQNFWWWLKYLLIFRRIGTQPAALHHYTRSIVTWEPLWGPLYADDRYHCWITRGMCQEALDLERRNGGERTESKCRKDKDHDLDLLQSSGELPCAVCRTRVGSNSIFCNGYKHWVHKKCSGLKRFLTKDPDYRCTRCQGTACPLDGRPEGSPTWQAGGGI